MNQLRLSTLCALVCAFALTPFATADNADMAHLSGAKWLEVQGAATVEAIHAETRELTLRDRSGNLATVTASEQVERFDEIEVGDEIVANYWLYLSAEFREPTPDEASTPLQVLAAAGKAIEGMPPTAAMGALIKAVVVVKVVDGVERDVTVQGPGGRYITLPVETPEILEGLNVGQKVILTYGEAMALQLEKAAAAE